MYSPDNLHYLADRLDFRMCATPQIIYVNVDVWSGDVFHASSSLFTEHIRLDSIAQRRKTYNECVTFAYFFWLDINSWEWRNNRFLFTDDLQIKLGDGHNAAASY